MNIVFISHATNDDAKECLLSLDAWFAQQYVTSKIWPGVADLIDFSVHDYAHENNDASSSRLLVHGGIGSGKTSLMSRVGRRFGVKQHAGNELAAGEHWPSTLARTTKEAGRLIILIDGLSESAHLRVPQIHRWQVAETCPLSSSIGSTLCHSIDKSLNGDARSQTRRLLADAMRLMEPASLASTARETAVWSALSHERAHAVVTDVRANPLFWLYEQATYQRETPTRDSSLARLLIPQGVFLANRILAYPGERYVRHSGGINAIGGLVEVAKKAWRAIRFCWDMPRMARVRHDSVEQDAFGLSITLLEALRIGLQEATGPDVPACLIETRGRRTVYLDQSLRWKEKRFAVLHELGHVLLDHKDASRYILQGNEPDVSAHNEQESEADAFADVLSHLLEGIASIVDSLTSSAMKEPSSAEFVGRKRAQETSRTAFPAGFRCFWQTGRGSSFGREFAV